MEPGRLSSSSIWSSIPAPKAPCFSLTPTNPLLSPCSPSSSSFSSSPWPPGQPCAAAPAPSGWPRTRPSAAAGRPAACPSSGRSACGTLPHPQPGGRGGIQHPDALRSLEGPPQSAPEPHHQAAHPLLLDPLVLLLLLALGVGVVGGHGLGQLLDLARDGAVVLLEVLGVLQDAVEVFLGGGKNATRSVRSGVGSPPKPREEFKLEFISSSASTLISGVGGSCWRKIPPLLRTFLCAGSKWDINLTNYVTEESFHAAPFLFQHMKNVKEGRESRIFRRK